LKAGGKSRCSFSKRRGPGQILFFCEKGSIVPVIFGRKASGESPRGQKGGGKKKRGGRCKGSADKEGKGGIHSVCHNTENVSPLSKGTIIPSWSEGRKGCHPRTKRHFLNGGGKEAKKNTGGHEALGIESGGNQGGVIRFRDWRGRMLHHLPSVGRRCPRRKEKTGGLGPICGEGRKEEKGRPPRKGGTFYHKRAKKRVVSPKPL